MLLIDRPVSSHPLGKSKSRGRPGPITDLAPCTLFRGASRALVEAPIAARVALHLH